VASRFPDSAVRVILTLLAGMLVGALSALACFGSIPLVRSYPPQLPIDMPITFGAGFGLLTVAALAVPFYRTFLNTDLAVLVGGVCIPSVASSVAYSYFQFGPRPFGVWATCTTVAIVCLACLSGRRSSERRQ